MTTESKKLDIHTQYGLDDSNSKPKKLPGLRYMSSSAFT